MSVDLRDRLRQALGPSHASAPSSAHPANAPTTSSKRSGGDVVDLVPGTVHEGDLGACFVGERAFPLDHVHGAEPLGGLLQLTDRAIACLARQSSSGVLDPSEVLFLDTETTGLSGGTGTYVFMVGLGFFESGRFVVRQYFMRDHAEEPAMLAALNGLFPRFRAVVSFNGKAFDLPLLQTRFVAGRRRSTLRAEPHLDLLFTARRLWRDRLPSCSLGAIEQAILRHGRQQDVPSWMIPQLYFRYVRDGDARPMASVFHHNLDDVLSLVSLACHLGRLLGDPLGQPAEPDELEAVARLYEELGYAEDAAACYERALRLATTAQHRRRIAIRLAQHCKRIGRSDRALELWRRLAASTPTHCAAHVELAKHYEHRVRDYGAAIAIVQEALTILELAKARRHPDAATEHSALGRRLARLLNKQRGSMLTTAPSGKVAKVGT